MIVQIGFIVVANNDPTPTYEIRVTPESTKGYPLGWCLCST